MLPRKRRRRRDLLGRVCDGVDLADVGLELLGLGWRVLTAPLRLLVDL